MSMGSCSDGAGYLTVGVLPVAAQDKLMKLLPYCNVIGQPGTLDFKICITVYGILFGVNG